MDFFLKEKSDGKIMIFNYVFLRYGDKKNYTFYMRPIFYDTETTGLQSCKDKIIEIAAYDPQNSKTFSTLINPQMPISQEATSIHNITDEMIKNSPSFAEIAPNFTEFCSGKVVLIAHNNDNFDKLFLEEEFKRNNLTMPSYLFFDTLKWARKYRSDLPKHSLQYLREVYEIPPNQAHRALDDVMILYEVYKCMINDLSIEKAFELLHQRKNEAIKFMPFGKYEGQPLQKIPKNYLLWLMKQGFFDKKENIELKDSFEKLGLLQGLQI